ncbi:MAG: hypothetical protein ATN34_01920 [Epulopiscium sp. Nele67-Bin002]|nr:MAG: hypothetical protein BEN18_01245 [Epulopiscium sp. Nuni2H_MBin001]OON90877.1 MAG: hypothetical protein ATN34_01920 [Epulopiscium sp. Nele67-Bin002]OON94679.1 MAG: hypothetical protein ATN33_04050 [Epulopiscium sp. Nele67-Bin001]
MGRMTYDPREGEKKTVSKGSTSGKGKTSSVNGKEIDATERYSKLVENIESLRPVGDVECEHIVYIEDYAYTYLYQYAGTNPTKEQAAIIVGEYYEDTKEAIVSGIIPVNEEYLDAGENWIGQKALDAVMAEKEQYFPGSNILGWLHMQPGYGTMVSSKEVKTHRDLFPQQHTILFLVDPINKVETFFIYEEETLKEQTGYYLYYDANPAMQDYMQQKPLIEEKEHFEDTAVKQFREMGSKRKQEYEDKQKTNFSVVAASLVVLALGVALSRVTGGDDDLFGQQAQAAISQGVQDEESGYSISFGEEELTNALVNEAINTSAKLEDDAVVIEASAPIVEAPETTVVAVQADTTVVVEVEEIEEEVVEIEEIEEEVVETAQEEIEEEAVAVVSENVEEAHEDEFIVYTVEEGDTIRSVSAKHFDSEGRVWDIIEWNDLENGDHIYVGQQLKIRVE